MDGINSIQILSGKSPFGDEFFLKIFLFLKDLYYEITNPILWNNLFIISSILSVILIGVSIYSLIRMRELQIEEKEELREEIKEAQRRKQEKEKKENPKWSYILSLLEGFNDSDWRMSIIEADSFMEEILKERGLVGNSVSELLEQAKSNGYKNINEAWSAHIVRNKIAHEGSNYPISQVEARKVIKMFQNFFEELDVV